MKVKVFTLPWRADGEGFDDAEVTAFLAERTAIEVSEHFFVHEKTPVLVLVVTWRGGDAGARPSRAARPDDRPDPSAALTPDERQRYEALRTWRNQHARKTGRPPYVVFTNRQAADIARKAPATRAALEEIQGIGTSRVEDYGDELLALLASLARATSEPPAGGPGQQRDG